MIRLVNIGDKLKALRTEKKLTQKQVADRLGVAVSAVSSYESGTRYPSYRSLMKLAGMYHVSCDYLIGLSQSRNIDVADLDDDDIELVVHLVDVLRNKNLK